MQDALFRTSQTPKRGLFYTMSDQRKDDILTAVIFIVCGLWIFSLLFKLLVWFIKIFRLPPLPQESNHYDREKAAGKEAILDRIARGLSIFCAVLCVLMILAGFFDINALKGALAFGLLSLILYFLSQVKLT